LVDGGAEVKSFQLQLVIALVLAVNLIPAVFLLHLSLQDPPRPAVAQAPDQCAVATRLPAHEELRARRAIGVRAGLFLFFPFVAYLAARCMACSEQPRAFARRGERTKHSQLRHALEEGTRGAGEFVILEHLREDQAVDQRQLVAALSEVLEENPTLEHREVAGSWIVRRPRM
jgi:hypothetical protein